MANIKIKPPENLIFWTLMWIVFGAVSAVPVIRDGPEAGTVIPILVGLAAIGMWFQVRTAGVLFGILNGALAIAKLFGLFTLGFTFKQLVYLIAFAAAAWESTHWLAAQATPAKDDSTRDEKSPDQTHETRW